MLVQKANKFCVNPLAAKTLLILFLFLLLGNSNHDSYKNDSKT
jgi:putative effector of murein hydrolase